MQTVNLFDDKLRLYLPDDFYQVEESEASDIYPSLERPQVIFAVAEFSRFLTFSLLDKSLGLEEASVAAREMRKLIWSLYPNSMLTTALPIRFGDFRCSGFSFKTGANEAQIYNTMFVVSFEDRLLMGTFGCRLDDDEGKEMLKKLIAEAEHLEAAE